MKCFFRYLRVQKWGCGGVLGWGEGFRVRPEVRRWVGGQEDNALGHTGDVCRIALIPLEIAMIKTA